MKTGRVILMIIATGLLAGGAATRAGEQGATPGVTRRLFSDPLLGFDDLLFVKRIPGSYSHMSDQNYGWWSRPGGGIFVLRNWKSDAAEVVCLTSQLPPGSFLRPDLSYDGRRILFAYCRWHPEAAPERNKVDKTRLPEDAFYHIFEMNLDGAGLRQITHGRYDDFDARYLPNGEIVFLSTRRGQFVQASKHCATSTTVADALPDSYVRCGGDEWRPVAVYTLHVMDATGENLRMISPFENFEWNPSIAADGRILYARWDYVDRDNMPFMSLWSTNPDGTNPQLVYGNHTRSPYGVFEARSVPGSRKIVFTASAHHSITGGSLVLLDPERGNEGETPLTRLTPEVCFPEIEGWPRTWYASPWPLSENLFLTAWSPEPLAREGKQNSTNALGLYVYDANSRVRELIYRDPAINSMDPIPVRPRARPPTVSSATEWDGAQEGRFLLLDVYAGLDGVRRGTVAKLRIVGVPAKTQPRMNRPQLGLTADDPGKFVLGTVPVESDGSAHFRVPSGVNVFLQALDKEERAVQTMRTVTYVQPGQTLACVGCHEHRATAPGNKLTLAAAREPSKLTPGPEGSWPLRFDRLVQPLLDQKCVQCHSKGSAEPEAGTFDLTSAHAYETLVAFRKPSLRQHVRERYYAGLSLANQGAAQTSALLSFLGKDIRHQALKLNSEDQSRLVTWMDLYAQRLGSFDDAQERQLTTLRKSMAPMFGSEP